MCLCVNVIIFPTFSCCLLTWLRDQSNKDKLLIPNWLNEVQTLKEKTGKLFLSPSLSLLFPILFSSIILFLHLSLHTSHHVYFPVFSTLQFMIYSLSRFISLLVLYQSFCHPFILIFHLSFASFASHFFSCFLHPLFPFLSIPCFPFPA